MRHIYVCGYGLGDTVYRRIGDEPIQGLITGITFRPDGGMELEVTWADGDVSSHYSIELSTEPTTACEESF